MKKLVSFRTLFICCCLFLSGCESATPEKYFGITVLNSNMIVGFAGNGMLREFQSPSAKMGASKDEIIQMKSSEMLANKIEFVEDALKKINGLSETADTKEMLQDSKALYNYVLPVYKKEYAELAKLYDEQAPTEKKEALARSIQEKYATGFETLYTKLISTGKIYAAKNSIKVNWAM